MTPTQAALYEKSATSATSATPGMLFGPMSTPETRIRELRHLGLGDDTPAEDGLSALEREAMACLDRMAGDPGARRRYAEIAERCGWPCFGMTWAEWAAEVSGGVGAASLGRGGPPGVPGGLWRGGPGVAGWAKS